MWIQPPHTHTLMCMFLKVSICICVCTHMCVDVTVWYLDLFLDYSLFHGLRQDLFLNPSSPVWLGWRPISSRGFLLSDLPALRMPPNLAFMWDCRSSCSCDKDFTNWVISPTSFGCLDLSFLIYKMGTIMIETIKWANNKAIRELYIIWQVLIWLIISYYY